MIAGIQARASYNERYSEREWRHMHGDIHMRGGVCVAGRQLYSERQSASEQGQKTKWKIRKLVVAL